eukprot:TRINITY_DN2291_c3_g1_i2.p1 TRINITY_DN2291_c3_g1~~TRINITY_DN2291_c3_g1_i2.p1  ORF type:complete len:233 (+),score=39.76 TRINITY_DN2291_c3_g1_i2:246-944(+)
MKSSEPLRICSDLDNLKKRKKEKKDRSNRQEEGDERNRKISPLAPQPVPLSLLQPVVISLPPTIQPLNSTFEIPPIPNSKTTNKNSPSLFRRNRMKENANPSFLKKDINNKKNSSLPILSAILNNNGHHDNISTPGLDYRSSNKLNKALSASHKTPGSHRKKKTKISNSSRCSTCNKRVGVLGFKCKCSNTYCANHRYSDQHNCTFDYRTAHYLALKKSNPQLRLDKLPDRI